MIDERSYTVFFLDPSVGRIDLQLILGIDSRTISASVSKTRK